MSSAKRKLVLKKLNSHNTIWHPESTLVFKSQKERLVIGRYVDEQLIPLDEEALDLCDEWKFNPDESLLETGNEEDESVEEAEETEENEVEVENKVESLEDEEAEESGEEAETKVDSLEEDTKDESDDENNDASVTDTKVNSAKNVEKETNNNKYAGSIYIYVHKHFCDIQTIKKKHKTTPPLFAKIQLLFFLCNHHRLSHEKLIPPASPICCFDKLRLHKFEIS